MGCLKGSSSSKKKDSKFICGKCGARTDKKSRVCKAIKIKTKDAGKVKQK